MFLPFIHYIYNIRAKDLHIMIVLPFLQILQVRLVVVGFFFEANVTIGFLSVPIFQVKEQPFYSIPNEERKVEQFFLLGGMNAFVIILNRI